MIDNTTCTPYPWHRLDFYEGQWRRAASGTEDDIKKVIAKLRASGGEHETTLREFEIPDPLEHARV